MGRRKRLNEDQDEDVEKKVAFVEVEESSTEAEPTAKECPSPTEVHMQSVEQGRWKRQAIATTLFVALLLYVFVPVLFSGIPSDPQVTAYIQEARLANGQRGEEGEPQQAIMATICNMRKAKTTYFLQVRTEEGEAEHFKYRIKPATCAHVILSTGKEPDYYESCHLFLYEARLAMFNLAVEYEFKDVHEAMRQ